MAMLGRLEARTALAALGGAAAFGFGSRQVWRRAIRHYTSASS
jgi:ABC-2 type transport system permease protein